MAWRGESVFPHVVPVSQTCRFIAELSGGGSQIRAEFTTPVLPGQGYTILDASIAQGNGSGFNVRAGTVTPLTFSGRPDVVVAPGSRVLSDSVSLSTADSNVVAVTVTASPGCAPASPDNMAMAACTPSPLKNPGTAPGEAFSVPQHLMWLRSLLVYGAPRRSVAGFGDSITVSPPSPPDSYWTDVLLGRNAAVVNAGVGGSYLTMMGMYATEAGLPRLNDLLAEPGLTDVVLFIGTNDVAIGVSPDSLLTAIQIALHEAQRAHVRMWVCTILPRLPFTMPLAAESARLSINMTLRSSWLPQHGGRLIDTDAALRDPGQPGQLLPAFDSGDHLHPSAAGAHELGVTIGLALGLLPSQ